MSEKTEKKPDPSIIKRYRREVSVDLSHEESEAYGKKLAGQKRYRDSLVEKAKQAAKNAAGDISAVSSEIDRLAVAVDTGKELRSTEVYDKLEGSQVKTYRADNHDLVDQRPAGFADEADMFADLEKPKDEDFPNPEPTPAKAKKPRKKKDKAN